LIDKVLNYLSTQSLEVESKLNNMTSKRNIEADKSVLEYIDKLPSDRKKNEAIQIMDLFSKITKKQPKMWGASIIGYGSYSYKYASGKEGTYARLSFSPRKTNLVLYVLNDFKDQKKLLTKLGKHKTGRICLYINKLADIDLEILNEILVQSWESAQTNPGC